MWNAIHAHLKAEEDPLTKTPLEEWKLRLASSHAALHECESLLEVDGPVSREEELAHPLCQALLRVVYHELPRVVRTLHALCKDAVDFLEYRQTEEGKGINRNDNRIARAFDAHCSIFVNNLDFDGMLALNEITKQEVLDRMKKFVGAGAETADGVLNMANALNEGIARAMKAIDATRNIQCGISYDEAVDRKSRTLQVPGLLVYLIQEPARNAMKVMMGDPEARGDRVDIRVSRDGDALVIEIADNGPGVTLQEDETVDDVIFSGKSTTQKFQGTGKGMPSCRQAIEQFYKGTITGRMREGGGLVVTIRIPGVQAAQG